MFETLINWFLDISGIRDYFQSILINWLINIFSLCASSFIIICLIRHKEKFVLPLAKFINKLFYIRGDTNHTNSINCFLLKYIIPKGEIKHPPFAIAICFGFLISFIFFILGFLLWPTIIFAPLSVTMQITKFLLIFTLLILVNKITCIIMFKSCNDTLHTAILIFLLEFLIGLIIPDS